MHFVQALHKKGKREIQITEVKIYSHWASYNTSQTNIRNSLCAGSQTDFASPLPTHPAATAMNDHSKSALVLLSGLWLAPV
jgi:hypothetical protein